MPSGTLPSLPLDGPIEHPYLLALDVPLHRADDGSHWADPSWARDLSRHFGYLSDLTVLLPMSRGEPPDGWVRLRIPAHVRCVEARRATTSRFWYLVALPRLVVRISREVRRSAIVHTGVAGYPIPVGWLCIPIARLNGRKIVVVVESAFWRTAVGERATWRRKLGATVWEAVNRWCLRQADYAAYSHADYRSSLPSPRADGGVLFQASWIEADELLSEELAERRWECRIQRGGILQVLFAARLVEQKGTRVLLDAIAHLRHLGCEVDFHVMGAGSDLERFHGLALESGVTVRLLAPVAYGPAFFDALGRFDLLLVPSLSDEQPRVVYDAAARAIPALASDLPGLRACVEHGRTGWLFEPGSARALAETLQSIDLGECRRRGLAARQRATLFTHQRMHNERRAALRHLMREGGAADA